MLQLSEAIANAFVKPCIDVLEDITPKTGVIAVGDVYSERMKVSSHDITMTSMISGDLQGKVVFSLSLETALAIAEPMLDALLDTLTADAQSAIVELMTMIVGNASVELSKSNHIISMSPVVFSYGDHPQLSTKGCPYPISIPLHSELGPFELSLALE